MNYRLFLLYFLVYFYSSRVAQSLNSTADFAGLLSLRASLSLRARDWPIKSDPCLNWTGVTCRSGRVVSLNLSGLRRTHLGRLNPNFSVDGLQNLTLLSSFNASTFLLPGSIPAWFGHRLSPGISSIDLRSAGVNGTIPADLGLLSNLTTLLLSHNALTGPIPSPLGNLSSLVSLDLSHNNLSGSLPASLLSLTGLTLLDLSSNNLTGKFPDLSSNVNGSGGVFNLSNNFYYGRISSSIGVLAEKFHLVDISNNYFEGEVIATNGVGNVSSARNCFRSALSQKNNTDCEEFYREKGEAFDGLSPPPASSPESPPKKTSANWKYILGGVLGGVALIIIVIIVTLLCLIRRRRPRRRRGSNANGVRSLVAPMPSSPAAVVRKSSAVGDLNYEKLFHATSGFSDMKLIKHGHTGDLYLGELEDGPQVVVKKTDVKTVRNESYAGELSFFGKFSHDRFVPFLGHCSKSEEEELLVYKYMPKGDLTSALHKEPGLEEDGLPSLDWITRLKIATGIAEALCFMHHECTPPMVHRDVQASSVLLDDKYEVRLGSLSDVQQQSDGQQNVFTRMLRSSKKLERSISGAPAICAYDVYCLGKVLLELVTGKLGISGSSDAAMSEWVESTLTYININEKELVTKIVDPSLPVDEDHLEEVWAVAIVAKSCLNLKPSRRPLARYVLRALENPLRVVREDTCNSSARIRTTSSRGSWHSALRGSWRQSSESFSATASRRIRGNSFRHSSRSQESGEELSFSFKRSSREIFPDPSRLAVYVDD
ncbi:probable LRR receptor-like serine/threonine-protein kinase At2g16250 [Typha latifolia]|uniref:probable LRR receptor-like serine/threonine-protein kinase At2g16250 n=1 Tax=Typha latifolia TaxID=4733 RepID=UPI003C304869